MIRNTSSTSNRRSHPKTHSKRRPLRLEPLEPRIALSGSGAVDALSPDGSADQASLEVSSSLSVDSQLSVLNLAAPSNIQITWNASISRSDTLSFDFNNTITDTMTWQLLENGQPIAVNTRYYNGDGTTDKWETEIKAQEFDPTNGKVVIMPAGCGKGALNVGNTYEILLKDGQDEALSAAKYGKFIGATLDGINETMTSSICLLDNEGNPGIDYFDSKFDEHPGATGVRAHAGEQLAAVILDAGTTVEFKIGELGIMPYSDNFTVLSATYDVSTNREGIVNATLSGSGTDWTLTIDTSPLAGRSGMVSVCIEDTDPNNRIKPWDSEETYAPPARYLGVIVKDSSGNVPEMPEYLTIGAVNENNPAGQQFFRGDAITGGSESIANKVGFQQYDSQYIYLNGGPTTLPDGSANPAAWRTSGGGYDGKKLIQSLRESAKFGSVPTVVYYNIMTKFSTDQSEPGEGPFTALRNIADEDFMVEYFKDLKFTIETIRSYANGTTVSLVIEPDFLAYMMQEAKQGGVYVDPNSTDYTYQTDPQKSQSWGGSWNIGDPIVAMTEAAYTAGFLPDPGEGNRLPNDLPGLIEAINRGVSYLATTTEGTTDKPLNLEYGWKFNLWAYDVPESPSLMKATDVLGWDEGRAKIATAAEAVAEWYAKAGILTGETGRTMDFIALDKYGTDGGATGDGYPQTKPGYTNPPEGNYFYNADHWNNYLLYAQTLHETLEELHEQIGDLPVRLWQIPVGHANTSNYEIGGSQVSALPNVDKQWEDSAVDFFFGDTFTGKSAGRKDEAAAVEYFKTDHAGTVVTYDEQTQLITWSNQLKAAADAGIEMIMFGPGLANSTQGGGYSTSPPMDDWFWASKVKEYYASGALFIKRPSVALNTASGQSTSTGNPQMRFTVTFSHAISGFNAEDVTLSGTAGTIAGADVAVETIIEGIQYGVTVTLKDSANTCAGDVIATIAAEKIQDKDGNSNLASTSTSNTVAYTPNSITGDGKSNVSQLLGGGEPLPGVLVSLTRSVPGFAERKTTTDSNGNYEFVNVPDGIYQVTVTPPHACLNAGSNTTEVDAEGNQTYDADFAMGAFRPAYITNRMMVTSSLPVGSTRWDQVVREALDIGEEANSQSTQMNVAATSQAEVTQYLVLGSQTASLVADAPPADTNDSVDTNIALAEPDDTPQEVAQITVASSPVPDAPSANANNAAPVNAVTEQTDGVSGEITQAVVAPVVEEAITRWEAAGLDQQSLDKMQNTTFVVSDLAGWSLGMTGGNTVWLDLNAAGCGWFVDPTPDDDEEFESIVASGPMQAIDPQALDRLDLLTVVSHELGHVVGLEDSHISDLMGPSLEMGWRIVPSAHDVALANIYS